MLGCDTSIGQPLTLCIAPSLIAAGMAGESFATAERALDERTIGHNPERLHLMKVQVLA